MGKKFLFVIGLFFIPAFVFAGNLFINDNNAGNVGIGTSSTNYAKLNVKILANELEGIHINRSSGLTTPYSYFNIENESGSAVFKIDQSGNVGIGIGNPSYKLSVAGGDIMLINNGWDPRFVIGDSLSIGNYGQIKWNSVNDYISLGTSLDLDTLVINESGNVGIGTNSPSGKLAINSSITGDPALNAQEMLRITRDATGGLRLLNYDGSAGVVGFSLQSTTTNFASVNDLLHFKITNGNIGIGTRSPEEKLQVVGNIANVATTTASTTSYLKLGTFGDGTYGSYISADSNYGSNSNTNLKFGVSNGVAPTTVMTILNTGNVGIGTTTPSDKLSVNGNIGIDNYKIYNGSSNDSAAISFVGSYTNIYGYNGIKFYSSPAGTGSQIERVRITNTGNLGLGVSAPQSKFTILKNQWIASANSDGSSNINMFRVNSNGEIQVGAPLIAGTLSASEDTGATTLFNMPVSSSSTQGTEMSASISIDYTPILKIYSESDGSGGVQNEAVKITGDADITGDLNISDNANISGILKVGNFATNPLGSANVCNSNYMGGVIYNSTGDVMCYCMESSGVYMWKRFDGVADCF